MNTVMATVQGGFSIGSGALLPVSIVIVHFVSVFVAFFFIWSPKHRWQSLPRLRMQTTMLCTMFLHSYETNTNGTRRSCFASQLEVCASSVCCGRAGGLRHAFSLPAETCQSPWGAGSRFTGQLRQPWQPSSSRLEQGMPLCRLLAWTGFVPFLPLYIHKLYI